MPPQNTPNTQPTNPGAMQPAPPVAPMSTQPVVPGPVPVQAAYPQVPNQAQGSGLPSNQSQGIDAKISNPKYWLTVFAITIADSLLYGLSQKVPGVSLLFIIISIAPIVLAYRYSSQLKARGVDMLPEADKLKIVIYITFSPIFASLFLYSRLKKTMPHSAQIINKMVWKVWLLLIVSGIPALMVTGAVLNLNLFQN